MSFSHLVRAYADLKQFDDAWRRIGEATTTVETTKERWFEAEIHCITEEIALKSPQQDAEKAETYFEHSLAIARQQQAKSWELRGAISLARLWRDQGKVQQARELLAPLLEELACRSCGDGRLKTSRGRDRHESLRATTKIVQYYRSAANRRCIKTQIIPRVGADDAMELEPGSLCW